YVLRCGAEALSNFVRRKPVRRLQQYGDNALLKIAIHFCQSERDRIGRYNRLPVKRERCECWGCGAMACGRYLGSVSAIRSGPVLVLSGDMPRKMHGTDFILTRPISSSAMSLYTKIVSSPAQAPAFIHQAISTAYAGRGVESLGVQSRSVMESGMPSRKPVR